MPLSTLNNQILQSLNSHPTFDPIMIFVSTVGDYILWLAIFAALYLWKGKRIAFSYAFTIFMASILVLALKSFFEVPRPEDVRFVLEAPGYSMPSGHTTISFTSAMFLHKHIKNGYLRPLIWILAALVSISRVFIGVHYPTDVLAGVILGCTFGYIGIKMEPYVSRYINEK
ncbi:MAG: phosphatase PAP2 family protein [Methanosarcinaceae archaeon]